LLLDSHHRKITYLRLSVTDRCNLRCHYCMPAEGIDYMAKSQLLTYEEMIRLLKVFVDLGITKLRITGGEPLVRKNLIPFLSTIRALHPQLSIHLTTNGSLLLPHLAALQEIQPEGINLSLDAFDRETFHTITRRDDFIQVRAALYALLETAIPVKINAVVMAGKNIHCLPDLIQLAEKHKVEVRLIEEMPFNGRKEPHKIYWSSQDIEKYLNTHHPKWTPLPLQAHSSARIFKNDQYPGTIGIIDAYSRSFCGTCNRVRINAQGDLINCLYGKGEGSLRDIIRGGSTDEELAFAIQQMVQKKYKNGFEAEEITRKEDPFFESMSTIGG
jgi:molybdenum cofactor biosynthesis protein A